MAAAVAYRWPGPATVAAVVAEAGGGAARGEGLLEPVDEAGEGVGAFLDPGEPGGVGVDVADEAAHQRHELVVGGGRVVGDVGGGAVGRCGVGGQLAGVGHGVASSRPAALLAVEQLGQRVRRAERGDRGGRARRWWLRRRTR